MSQRTLKFRAWDTKRKEMINPGWWGVQSETGLAFENEANYLPFNGEEIIMQFTGLLDKNGKEIYEGDILKLRPEENIIVQVVNEPKLNGYGVRDKKGYWQGQLSNKSEFEIIGNIYSDPHLLDGDK